MENFYGYLQHKIYFIFSRRRQVLYLAKKFYHKHLKIQERNDTTITSYNNAINAKEYICSISFDVMIRLNVYYTKDPIVDNRSYYSIEKNIRQLTIGFGLDVKPNEEDSSLIHALYNNRLIESKKFSLENKKTMNGKSVTNNIRFRPVRKSLLFSYKYNFTAHINTFYNKWGIMFNSISIGNETQYTVNINSFTPLNSAINTTFRSYDIYQAIKYFVTQKHSYLKNQCKEVKGDETISIRCTNVTEEDLTETVTIDLEQGIIFKIPLNYLFLWEKLNSCLLTGVYFDVNDKEHEIQFGKKFFLLFDLIEFDFDHREITLYSNDTVIEKYEIGNIHQIKIFI